ncbi:hypothetical protein BDW71DRAFT_121222 [Aspergillus fruticulosus]
MGRAICLRMAILVGKIEALGEVICSLYRDRGLRRVSERTGQPQVGHESMTLEGSPEPSAVGSTCLSSTSVSRKRGSAIIIEPRIR